MGLVRSLPRVFLQFLPSEKTQIKSFFSNFWFLSVLSLISGEKNGTSFYWIWIKSAQSCHCHLLITPLRPFTQSSTGPIPHRVNHWICFCAQWLNSAEWRSLSVFICTLKCSTMETTQASPRLQAWAANSDPDQDPFVTASFHLESAHFQNSFCSTNSNMHKNVLFLSFNIYDCLTFSYFSQYGDFFSSYRSWSVIWYKMPKFHKHFPANRRRLGSSRVLKMWWFDTRKLKICTDIIIIFHVDRTVWYFCLCCTTCHICSVQHEN